MIAHRRPSLGYISRKEYPLRVAPTMLWKWTNINSLYMYRLSQNLRRDISFHYEFLNRFSSCPRETFQEVECSYDEGIKFIQKSRTVRHTQHVIVISSIGPSAVSAQIIKTIPPKMTLL